MKNKEFVLPILILIAIIVLVSGGIYYANSKRSQNKTGLDNPSGLNITSSTTLSASGTQNGGSSGQSGRSDLRALFLSDKTAACNLSGSNSSGSISGTVYLDNGLMRGDIKAKKGTAAPIDTHIIKNQGKIYLWSGSQGIQMTLSNFTSAKQSASASVNLDQNVSYECSNWKEDLSKFSLPGGVNFMEITPPAN